MRVTSNTLVSQLVSQLDRLSSDQSLLTQQMATGQRLSQASDDVPATGRVMGYETEKNALRQYERNSQIGLTNIKISTTALSSIKDIASQAFNLVPNAQASGDPSEQAAFAQQIDGILEQAFSLANSQNNGTYLFGASANNTAPFTATRDAQGHITAVTYTNAPGANGNPPAVGIDENTQILTTNTGAENQQLAAFLNNLVAARDAVSTNNTAGMAAAQNAIGGDEDNLVGMLGALTSSQSRIEAIQIQNQTRFNQLNDLIGNDTDVDMAATIMKFQTNQKSYQAALQVGSKLMQQSLLDYLV